MINFKETLIPLKEAPNYIPHAEKTLRNWKDKNKCPRLFVQFEENSTILVDLDEYGKYIEEKKDNNERKVNEQNKRLNLD